MRTARDHSNRARRNRSSPIPLNVWSVGYLDTDRFLPASNPDPGGLSLIAKKLRFRPDHRVAILNAPDGYVAALQPGPRGIATELEPSQTYDAVQLFVHNSSELKQLGADAIGAVKPDGLLWITYPKGGKTRGATDLPATPWWVRRDVLGEITSVTGYRAVAFVALDDYWTALRFKSE